MINAVIADQPDDLVINTHICRGNFHSTWLSSGGYAPVAAKLFGKENVDAYYLEFDDDRSGDFAPLAEVSDDKQVVLGLVTSKRPELENPETIKARIYEAAQYCRWSVCACPPNAVLLPQRKATSSLRSSSGLRSHS